MLEIAWAILAEFFFKFYLEGKPQQMTVLLCVVATAVLLLCAVAAWMQGHEIAALVLVVLSAAPIATAALVVAFSRRAKGEPG